jgi:hypothetical protein
MGMQPMRTSLQFSRLGGSALADSARRMLPAAALVGLGVVLLSLARTQPMWLGANVGPGLFAQVAALGVLGFGLAWALVLAVTAPRSHAAGCAAGDNTAQGLPMAGPALLGAVLAFALTLPVLGLVGAAAVAAALAAWAAGERQALALVVTVGALAGLVALVGLILLPPTAPLWPRF